MEDVTNTFFQSLPSFDEIVLELLLSVILVELRLEDVGI
jgi:hypothetical protein